MSATLNVQSVNSCLKSSCLLLPWQENPSQNVSQISFLLLFKKKLIQPTTQLGIHYCFFQLQLLSSVNNSFFFQKRYCKICKNKIYNWKLLTSQPIIKYRLLEGMIRHYFQELADENGIINSISMVLWKTVLARPAFYHSVKR